MGLNGNKTYLICFITFFMYLLTHITLFTFLWCGTILTASEEGYIRVCSCTKCDQNFFGNIIQPSSYPVQWFVYKC
jgi:hypothetical protein